MSKYKRIQSQFKNAEWLKEAIKKLGFVFEEGTALPLYGYHGDRRRETAELVIRRANVGPAANDLGFHRLDDGTWEVIISEYDSRTRAAQMVKQLQQEYADISVHRMAWAKGYTVAGHSIKADGTRVYQFVRR